MINLYNIALFLHSKNKSYASLVRLASQVSTGLANMTVPYSSPLPTLTSFDAQIATLQGCITAWGSRGNHGSSSDKVNLENAAHAVRLSLIQLSQYVMDTDPQNPTNWVNAGFEIKSVPSSTVPFEKVQNLRQLLRGNLPAGAVKIHWNRPMNSGTKKVNCYKVFRGTSTDFSQAVEVGLDTKNSFIDYPPAGQVSYYFIVAYNAAGKGATSDVLMVSMPV